MKVLFLLAVFALAFAAEEEVKSLNSARVLVSKSSLSQYAVEDMDFVIQYDLFNVGDQPAYSIVLDDRASFPTNSFEIVKGLFHVKWPKLQPGENITHSVIIRPLSYGVFNYTSAPVTYLPSENAKELKLVYSTSPGQGYIYRKRDYDRRFSSKLNTWAVFLLLSLPTLALPFYFYNSVATKYPIAGAGRKNK